MVEYSAIANIIGHPYFVVLSRWLLGCVFLIAAIGKLWDLSAFAEGVRAYNLLPRSLIHPFTKVAPWLEVAISICLLLGIATKSAAGVGLALLACFSVAAGINLMRNRNIDCHCFGTLWGERISWNVLLRNIFLGFTALDILLFYNGHLAVEGWLMRFYQTENTSLIEFIIVLQIVVLLMLFIALVRQLFALSRSRITRR